MNESDRAGGKPDDTWSYVARQYARSHSPLKPCDADVALIQEAITGHDNRVLLLGVTPALTALGHDLLAVDASAPMIAALWSDARPGRRVVKGDWRALPCASASRDAVIGDGVFSAADADPSELLFEMHRVLAPGGIVAIRCFCAPERPDTETEIEQDLWLGQVANLSALKSRIAMRLAAGNEAHRVPVAEILEDYNRLFPDRAALLRHTGWPQEDLATIDCYRGQSTVYRFLPQAALVAQCKLVFPSVQVLRSQGYDLADRCPVLVLSTHAR